MERSIADYALIGNTHTAALIGGGAIDWCCLPHFDSGAVFCRLLDRRRGGTFAIAPAAAHRSRMSYRSAGVLQTDFESDGGGLRLLDFRPVTALRESRRGADRLHCHRLLRGVEAVSGTVDIELRFEPTFDFARAEARILVGEEGAEARAGRDVLMLHGAPRGSLRAQGAAVHGRLRLRAGERCWLTLAYAHAGQDEDEAARRVDPEALLAETERHWAEWEAHTRYEGVHEARVRQSARVLKMLTFGPTGALVAAPTTSLPEEIGGVRNWDYRFCWLRDASLVLRALMAVGHHGSADDFFQWLEDLCEGECDHLQIMYRLDGGTELPELELPHLAGHRGSRPVRIGNGAAAQTQLDVYGHVLDAAWYSAQCMRQPLRPGFTRMLAFLADQAAQRWRERDHGLWEVRTAPRHFVSSKLWCWVALDRAVRLAAAGKLPGDARRWRHERDAVRAAIETHGVDARGAFVRAFDLPGYDASVLAMPRLGFIDACDPRMRATVDAVRRHLTEHGLVFRYRADDGLPGREGTFILCSLWLVDTLAAQGRLDEAHALYERVCSFGSSQGLFAEQVDPVAGRLLGNYPQGFTHLALVRSAQALTAAERALA
jgi:alpha,alpha-trehalase